MNQLAPICFYHFPVNKEIAIDLKTYIMIKSLFTTLALISGVHFVIAQDLIPMDTLHWDIQARSYVLEPYMGKESVYLQGGSIALKNANFLNGTIEYDVFLKETQAFPGVYFRINGSDAEHFYLRSHQSGNPDANQALPLTKGIAPWQLYYGVKYSFPYEYHYDDWTHVKIVVNNERAQVYLDHSEKPHLSWQLFHQPKAGGLSLTGGNAEAVHLANIRIDRDSFEMKDYSPLDREPTEGLIPAWEVSDKFDEKLLKDPSVIRETAGKRSWVGKINVEEGTAANISRQVQRYDDNPGNTVFARITVNSETVQSRLFEFGYSDRVVVILNNEPIYRGTNNYRSRDYRYLGTVGLFDAVYLHLKKGNNTLLLGVSEDFGGWLVTGRIVDMSGIRID